MRWNPPADPDETPRERAIAWGDSAGPLVERAIALGGRVIGFGHERLTVDFSWDGLYDAVDFLTESPLAPELSSGFADGEVIALSAGNRLALGIGEGIVRATKLAELARPGEVLVDPEFARGTRGALNVLGEPGKRPGRPDVPALVLDPVEPLCEVPPLAAPESSQRSSPPESVGPLSVAGADLLGFVDEVGTQAGRALLGALARRDSRSLQELAETLRAEGSLVATERIEAMAALTAGKGGEALRRLRAAKEEASEAEPSVRARASLALAVALGSLHRNEEALLETLEGLAFARLGADARGERALGRFLAQLGDKWGEPECARLWLAKSA